MAETIWRGEFDPLGATFDGAGTNFAVYSEHAEMVELCLFDDDDNETRYRLPENKAYVHHGYLNGVMPGQRYGFRVHGPWDPQRGMRYNPHKLLVDPYAKAIDGSVTWGTAIYAHEQNEPDKVNTEDSAKFMPKSVVINPYFEWGHDRPPRTARSESIIYETHVRGLTQNHPDIPENIRGTYAGLGHPATIEYLSKLGVTAVELLPVHQFVDDHFLIEKGLSNYWGYSSVGFLAPHNRYSSGGSRGQQVIEFKSMVRSLHRAGIEVILDVVYNHTAEGNHLGPSLSLKGFDNHAYYRLDHDQRFYVDYTGTGNTLDARHPNVLKLVMDSLRYWVTEMHVDGFRFDLASTLAREDHAVDRLSSFFDLVYQDPVINRMKLIAEPWDVGEGGYQLGNFPPLWSEWNGQYRDTVRDFWRGSPGTLANFASRFTGSSDLYEATGRRTTASINFVTAHDGFTLADLVSYDNKHNDDNGERNRDGDSHNNSWNSGSEGETDDPEVLKTRRNRKRAILATLMLSQGVPMLLGGDELGRTQGGNNNAYCQNNDISWYDWENIDEDTLKLTKKLIELRKQHPVFRRRHWFDGLAGDNSDFSDVAWFSADGAPMSAHDWTSGYQHTLMVFLNGDAMDYVTDHGVPVVDDSFLILFNSHWQHVPFCIPKGVGGSAWRVILDTNDDSPESTDYAELDQVDVGAWSLVVLKRNPDT